MHLEQRLHLGGLAALVDVCRAGQRRHRRVQRRAQRCEGSAADEHARRGVAADVALVEEDARRPALLGEVREHVDGEVGQLSRRGGGGSSRSGGGRGV